jgi:hypothetical protein
VFLDGDERVREGTSGKSHTLGERETFDNGGTTRSFDETTGIQPKPGSQFVIAQIVRSTRVFGPDGRGISRFVPTEEAEFVDDEFSAQAADSVVKLILQRTRWLRNALTGMALVDQKGTQGMVQQDLYIEVLVEMSFVISNGRTLYQREIAEVGPARKVWRNVDFSSYKERLNRTCIREGMAEEVQQCVDY